MKVSSILYNILIFCGVIILDRYTKIMALSTIDEVILAPFLSCKVVFNRGIVCGLFNSSASSTFLIITASIITIYFLFFVYTIHQAYEKLIIAGELLVLAGGFSNIVDRFMYAGVVDFILVSYKNWAWPIFNIADACIVLGVIIMMAKSLVYNET